MAFLRVAILASGMLVACGGQTTGLRPVDNVDGSALDPSATYSSGGAAGAIATGAAGGAGTASMLVGAGASPGCGKSWTHATAQWVEVAGPASHTNPPPLGPLVSIQGPGDTEDRGYWVYLPKNYDPQKPGGYTVIYNGAGCDDPDIYNAGKDGFPYQTVTDFDAIMVGLDYDTHSAVPLCYDNRNPNSNDFAFVPWLMDRIAHDFCVDESRQFFSGYSSGAWLAQQLNCAFPARFRGMVSTRGSEPMSQPPCNPAPMAFFHVHDIGDESNTYASILPGCSRILEQNGCSVTDCSNPESSTLTIPYELPMDIRAPQGTVCRQFSGCPVGAPVVFCTTHLPATANHYGDGREWLVPAFWDFMHRF
jgi:hypothetical protein